MPATATLPAPLVTPEPLALDPRDLLAEERDLLLEALADATPSDRGWITDRLRALERELDGEAGWTDDAEHLGLLAPGLSR